MHCVDEFHHPQSVNIIIEVARAARGIIARRGDGNTRGIAAAKRRDQGYRIVVRVIRVIVVTTKLNVNRLQHSREKGEGTKETEERVY